MSEETLEGWLQSRVPRIPAPFLSQLRENGEGPSGALELATLGTDALGRVLERPGRSREAALHLLTADAFFTYACEAVLPEGDVQAGLEGLLERLGGRFS